MAQSEQKKHVVASIPQKTICVASSTQEFSYFKKVFLTILEAKYLLAKGKQVMEESFVKDEVVHTNYFIYVNMDWLEDHLPPAK